MFVYNDEVKVFILDRLDNYKFESASEYFKDYDESIGNNELNEIKMLVDALAQSFGNVGWFDGNLGLIVDATVLYIRQKLVEMGMKE